VLWTQNPVGFCICLDLQDRAEATAIRIVSSCFKMAYVVLEASESQEMLRRRLALVSVGPGGAGGHHRPAGARSCVTDLAAIDGASDAPRSLFSHRLALGCGRGTDGQSSGGTGAGQSSS
jgi:hypothetical protein